MVGFRVIFAEVIMMSENVFPELTTDLLALGRECGSHGVLEAVVLDGCPSPGVIVDTLVYVPDNATALLIQLGREVTRHVKLVL